MKGKFSRFFAEEYMGLAGVVFGGIILYFLLANISEVWGIASGFLSIFTPFLWGFVIAYFVNFIVVALERRPLRKIRNKKTQRVVSLILGYIIAIIIVTLIILIIVPQTIDSISKLVKNMPWYITNVQDFLNSLVENHSWAQGFSEFINEKLINLEDILPTLLTDYILPYTMDFTKAMTGAIINVFVALISSIYFIASKERFIAQFKKMLYAHFPEKKINTLMNLGNLSNETFSNFISGKLIDSLIIAIIAFIVLGIFNFPYSMLVSVIIGITNIIPFIGPIIGAVPSFFIIFITSPGKALWFLLFIIILQQVDGNIIGPKILGYSIGLSAFWIIVAVMVGNDILGFVGMVIGVPAFAVFYILFKNWSEKKLEKKNMPIHTEDYVPSDKEIRF